MVDDIRDLRQARRSAPTCGRSIICRRIGGSRLRRRPATSTRQSRTASMSKQNELEGCRSISSRRPTNRPTRSTPSAATEGLIEELKKTIAASRRGAGAVIEIDGRIKRPVEHQPEADAAADRARSGLRLHRAADHRERQDSYDARHHPPDLVAGSRADQGLHRDARPTATSRSTRRSSASTGCPSRCRSADGDAPMAEKASRALELGKPRRRSARRALPPVDALAARCAAGGPRPAGFIHNLKVEPIPRRSTPSRQRVWSGGAARATLSILRTRFTPTSATSVGVNGKMVPRARGSRTATSSRS